ncbi:PAP2 superfamily protein [Nonomuraea fuscirosea]|uniref:PAP2 superfamily protein n=2 Tax=Nonomuraea fuscirosea TaxID=1291556 RepID=A0A2T0N1T0_9ACTN|nr:PAP2 superfamily protein [Nonomuraea fuscirosea]
MLGYFGIMAVIVAVARNRLPEWPMLLAGYALAALLLLALAAAMRRRPGSRPVAVLRFAAPLLVLPFVYSAAAETVLVLHGRFVDDVVLAWERALFGGSPNVAAVSAGSPPLTELLTLCYFSYYGCFLLPIVLYVRGREPLAERYLFAAMTTLLICYLGFIAVPLAGPVPATPELAAAYKPSGYLITSLQNQIMAAFDPPGACFPSPHVAGAWITLLSLRRHISTRARLALGALTAGLTAAVVYDWYHYLSDVAAGLAVALAVHFAIERYAARKPARQARSRVLQSSHR